MGLETATERAVFNYLEKQVEEAEALAWTKGIFSHPDIAEVMLSPIWKKQTDIHNEIKNNQNDFTWSWRLGYDRSTSALC